VQVKTGEIGLDLPNSNQTSTSLTPAEAPATLGGSDIPHHGDCDRSHPQNKPLWFEVDPLLVASASRAGEGRLLWFWYLARYSDQNGSNHVYLGDLFVIACEADKHLSKTQFDRYLRDGVKAGYWTLTRQGRRGEIYRRRLFYTSYGKLALRQVVSEGTDHVGTLPHVLINLHWHYFLPTVYAGWFAAKIHAKNGKNKQNKRLKSLHISRPTIERVWGITTPTQIKWERIAHIHITAGIEQADENARPGTDTPEYATPYATMDGKVQWSWRSINSYKPPAIRISESKRTRLTVRCKCRAMALKLGTESKPLSTSGQAEKSAEGLPTPFVRISFDYSKPRTGFKQAKGYNAHHEHNSGEFMRVFIGRDKYGRNRWERVISEYAQRTPIVGRDLERMSTLEWFDFKRSMRCGMAAL
jgi:hypothetical protein